MLKILVIGGSRRQENYTTKVAKFITQVINQRSDMQAELFTVLDAPIELTNEGYAVKLDDLNHKVEQADALVVASAEYNHGYPGTLKYVLDTIAAKNHRKPVGLVGVSSGVFGGTRVIEVLSLVLRELGFLVLGNDVNVGQVKDNFKTVTPQDEATWNKRINKMLDELAWVGNALAKARTQD